jgi:hypothetical protein
MFLNLSQLYIENILLKSKNNVHEGNVLNKFQISWDYEIPL